MLPRLAGPLCERCGAPTAWPVRRCAECSGRRLAFARARAALVYDTAVRALVAGWKERGLRGFTGLAGHLVVEIVPRPEIELIAWVPPDLDRLLLRGHHPAESLARELGDRWAIEPTPALARTRATPRQAGLGRAERRRNIAGAFESIRRVPTRVGVVDDVYTSGATASAAASALRRAGARRVEVVTFARAIR
jgi:predicted amidophosphoribosyltransferase